MQAISDFNGVTAPGRGRHEMTWPAFPATGYVVRALAPESVRRQVKRVTLDAIPRDAP